MAGSPASDHYASEPYEEDWLDTRVKVDKGKGPSKRKSSVPEAGPSTSKKSKIVPQASDTQAILKSLEDVKNQMKQQQEIFEQKMAAWEETQGKKNSGEYKNLFKVLC